MDLSIVIPSYRAASFLERNVPLVKEEAKKFSDSFEILLVEGGNTDNTAEIASAMAERDNSIVHIHRGWRLGRGEALSIGFGEAKGKVVAYLDADLEIGPEYLPKLLKQVDSRTEVVIASKYMPESIVKTTLKRRVFSKIYNLLVWLILGSKIKCHQSGMKCFKRDAIRRILRFAKDKHWFWDTEVLLIAQWMGMKIAEAPVNMNYGLGETTVALWKDSIAMLGGIISLKKRRLLELRNLGD